MKSSGVMDYIRELLATKKVITVADVRQHLHEKYMSTHVGDLISRLVKTGELRKIKFGTYEVVQPISDDKLFIKHGLNLIMDELERIGEDLNKTKNLFKKVIIDVLKEEQNED